MTAVATTADGVIPRQTPASVKFLGREAAYWRLRIKGAVLLVFTLGLYRFWFATDVRRFLWSHTEIGGETLEYTGLAGELLGGFLLAIAIVVPLYTGIAVAALALDAAEGVIAGIAFVLLVLLGQMALYRARRYRLTHTVFRGVRFDQHGAAWRYALYALAWWTLIVVTLGLAYPWAQAGLQRFKMRHTSYGDLAGSFAGSGTALFLRGLPIWLAVFGPLVGAFVALSRMVDWDALNRMIAAGGNSPLAVLVGGAGAAPFVVAGTAAVASILAALSLYPLFAATMMRWWISGLRFGAVSVRSHLRTWQIYRIYLRFVGLLTLFLLALAVIVGGGVALFNLAVRPNRDVAELLTSTFTVILYVVAALGASTIYQVAVTFALWRQSAQSAELSGAAALAEVRAAGAPSSALGEGLADALGVGGI